MGVALALGRIDEAPAAVGADVAVGLDLALGAVGGFAFGNAHDQDRVVENLVGDVAADLGQVLDTAGLEPALAPQLVALGAGIIF